MKIMLSLVAVAAFWWLMQKLWDYLLHLESTNSPDEQF